jgi:prepilin-type N-terminal cleavage/methylation domain-containing protein
MIKDQSGFTIVELIVTIVMLGVVVLSLSSLFVGIQRTQVQTGYIESATRAAQREVEALRNNNYDQLTPGQNIDFTSQLPANLPQTKSGTVVVTEPIPGLRRVDVTVSYTFNGTTRNIELSSMIGEIGIAQ